MYEVQHGLLISTSACPPIVNKPLRFPNLNCWLRNSYPQLSTLSVVVSEKDEPISMSMSQLYRIDEAALQREAGCLDIHRMTWSRAESLPFMNYWYFLGFLPNKDESGLELEIKYLRHEWRLTEAQRSSTIT